MDTVNADDLRTWPDKIVGQSFERGDFTGWWYEDSRLEVHYRGEFLEMVYFIDPELAESEFLYIIGAPLEEIYHD